MEERLKQRLVGGAVLVSLIVIFVPMLVEEKVVSDTTFSKTNIPEKPKIQQRQLESHTILPKPITQKKPLEPSPEIEESAKLDDGKRFGKIERPTPAAWIVQVASFSRRENANKLGNRLSKAGMPVQLKEVVIKGKRHYRVQMLPQLDKKQAEKLVKRIKKEFDLKASVVRYAG